MKHRTGIFFSDLDGTLIDKFGNISQRDLNSLKTLKDLNILRVIATGRSYFSAKKIIKEDFPIDYLICSTGSLTLKWPSEEVLEKHNLEVQETEFAVNVFKDHKLDFVVLHEALESHKYDLFIYNKPHPDILRRNKFYRGHYRHREYNYKISRKSCQLIGFIDKNDELFNELKEKLSNYNIIPTTSPIDDEAVWVEVYPKHVSKGSGVTNICSRLGIEIEKSGGIGNDINDLEMLKTVKYPFVVESGHKKLKKLFKKVADHKNSGVSEAIEIFLKSISGEFIDK
ncbi:MAG: HAD-IIB family hydrolase [bacterium]